MSISDLDVGARVEDRECRRAAVGRDDVQPAALQQRREGEDVAEVVIDDQHCGADGGALIEPVVPGRPPDAVELDDARLRFARHSQVGARSHRHRGALVDDRSMCGWRHRQRDLRRTVR